MLVESLVTVASRVRLCAATSDGPQDRALLVIHGGPDWGHTYLREPLINLAGRHRLVLPDLRGCGRSTVGLPDPDYTPDAAVADLVALLDVLGVDRADVLGFSYGGILAQRLAVFAPTRVRRLIIASRSVEPVPDDAVEGWPERNERMRRANAAWADTKYSGPALTRAAARAAVAVNAWTDAAAMDYLARVDRIHFTAEWLRPLSNDRDLWMTSTAG